MTGTTTANPRILARTLPALVGVLLHLAQASPALAQPEATGTENGPTVKATDTDAGPSAETKELQLGFDPALAGLPGFPVPTSAARDFDLASELIEARIVELRARDRAEADAAEAEGPGLAAPGTAPAEDPRIEQLIALRDDVQQGATVAAHVEELEAAIKEKEESLAALERDGLEDEPPYPIALLDQLRSERALIRQTEKMADRSQEQARRRVETTSTELREAMRARRQQRDRLLRAEPKAISADEERQLEIARLSALVAFERHQLALAQQVAARRSEDLATAKLALIEERIARISQHVVFTREALEERLAEVESREGEFRARIKKLTRAGDLAEAALFRARRRLLNAGGGEDSEVLRELVQAREQELATARSGVDYARDALVLADTARTLLTRRHDVLRGTAEEEWSRWLNETSTFMREVAEEQDFTLTNLGALRAIELALGRRLAAPDLAEDVRRALMERVDALERHEALAEELIDTRDQVRSLAERLRLELEPRVRARPLEQRLLEAQERLTIWWNSELFAFQDQGIYARDLVKGMGVFILVLAAVSLTKLLLRRTVLPRLAGNHDQQQRTYRALALAVIRKTSLPFVVILAFYEAMMVSGLAHGNLRAWLWSLLVVAIWLQLGIWASAGVADLFQRQRSRKERSDPSAVTGYGLILFFVRVGIWMIVVVSVLSHFDYPIAGLIGALGVGGIAVAFAVQNILSDIFNSMAIVLDKPFRVGDFIVTGNTLGVVEHIGVKTTQIRSLSGEQVILSNTDLLNSCIHNYKRMRERRVVFKIGVVYETPADTLEQIPNIIAEVIRALPHARFDRAHFFEYGDFSLVFEIVYYVYGADYTRYMDTQQAANLGIYRQFQQKGIGFAYPTQEIIVRRPEAAPGPVPKAAP